MVERSACESIADRVKLLYGNSVMRKNTAGEKDVAVTQAFNMKAWVMSKIKTLRFQVLAIVIASVLIPSFLAGWFSSNRISDILRNQVYSEIETKTQRLSEQLSGWLEDRSREVKAFTVSYLLNEDLRTLQKKVSKEEKEQSRQNIRSYLTYLLEDNDRFSGMAILNSDGSPLIKQPVETMRVLDTIPFPPDQTEHIHEITTEDGSWLVITQIIDLGRGFALNIFTTFMQINYLQNRIVDLVPDKSIAYLLDNEGHIKASSIDSGKSTKAPEGAVALLEESETRSIYRGLQGKEVIAANASLEKISGWSVILENSKKEALLPLTNFRRQIVLMALALAFLFLIPALLLARALIIPLEELSRVSKRIRTGEPGLQVKTRIGGELGDFILTFNSMSLSLAESLKEITEKSEELRVMSITDPLTGKYNRRYIVDYLGRELELAIRTGDPLTILMIDLDRFKEYNDTYGHIAGDMALKQLSDVLVQTIRKTDVLARYGGEEWIICLSHTDKDGGVNIAEKIVNAVANKIFHLKGQETRITVSIGVSTAPEDGTTHDTIVEAADSAMYHAKTNGRNQVQVFTGPDSS